MDIKYKTSKKLREDESMNILVYRQSFTLKALDYPSISFDEAKNKVNESIVNISKTSGIDSDDFFQRYVKSSDVDLKRNIDYDEG